MLSEDTSPTPADSPFSRHFDTNFTPSLQETKEIRVLLAGPEAEIASISAQIQRLQERGLQLHEFTSKHRALLSPSRCLPHDILGEIFAHAVSPGREFPIRSIHKAPLVFTRICRTWREVALRSPRLWNAIHIQFPTFTGRPGSEEALRVIIKRRLEGVGWWLSHSGSLPLRISVYIPAGIDDDDYLQPIQIDMVAERMQVYSEVIDFVIELAPRLKSVILQAPAPLLASLQKHEDLATQLSHLQELQMIRTCIARDQGSEDSDSWADANSMPSVFTAPRLRLIWIHNERINMRELPERWDALTHVSITSPRYSTSLKTLTALRVLQRCAHSLEHLLLDLVLEAPGPQTPTGAIIMQGLAGIAQAIPTANVQPSEHILLREKLLLPKLTDLSVSFEVEAREMTTAHSHSAIAKFFDGILAPSLQNLSVKLSNSYRGGSSGPIPECPFQPFLQSSACQLASLDVCMPLQDTALTACLRDVGESIVVLSLTGDQYFRSRGIGFSLEPDRFITKELAKSLTLGVESSPLIICPNLRTLSLFMVDAEIASDLSTFASSRQEKLKTFRVNFRLRLRNGAIISSQLKVLREKGMKVTWRSGKAGAGVGRVGRDNPAEGVSTVSDDLMDPFLMETPYSVVY